MEIITFKMDLPPSRSSMCVYLCRFSYSAFNNPFSRSTSMKIQAHMYSLYFGSYLSMHVSRELAIHYIVRASQKIQIR
jgi:hypothetical protein